METRVHKWEHRLALCIPRPSATATGIGHDSPVELALTLLLLLLFLASACSVTPRGSDSSSRPGPGPGVPLPPNEDFDVICFLEFEEAIVARAPVFDAFHTRDGGLTWQQEGFDYGRGSGSASGCSPNKKMPDELWVPPDGQVRYRFHPGESIEISMDKGHTWELAYDLTPIRWDPIAPANPDRRVIVQPGPWDAMLDPRSGNLLLAMGHAGVLLRLPSDEWRWVQVGRYAHDPPSPTLTPVSQEDAPEEILPPAPTLIPADLEIGTEDRYVNALTFSPDGLTLAASGFMGGIKLFDFRGGGLLHWQQWGQDVQHRKLYGAVFSADGKTLITCGTNVDKTLNLWDVGTWTLIRAHEGYQTSALHTGVYDGRQYLAVGGDQKTDLFQLPDGKLLSTVPRGSLSLRFIPGTPYLAIGGHSDVTVWDLNKMESVRLLQGRTGADGQGDSSSKILALGYDPSEDLLMALRENGRLIAWEVTGGNLVRELVLQLPHGWYVNTAAFSEDGRLAAVGMHNGPLVLFDSQTGQMLSRQWIDDSGTLMKLAFSPDSEWLAAGYVTGQIRIWQVDRLIGRE